MSQLHENHASLESISPTQTVCGDETPCAIAFVVTGDGVVDEMVMLSRDGCWCRGDGVIGTPVSTLAWFAHSESAREQLGAALARCAVQGAVHEDIDVSGGARRLPRIIAARFLAIVLRGSLRITGVLTDVTTERFLEERLRSARKTERLGQAAVEVAREFNRLLSIIAAGPLLTRPAELSPAADAARLRQSALACERAEQLTRQLLVFDQSAAPDGVEGHTNAAGADVVVVPRSRASRRARRSAPRGEG